MTGGSWLGARHSRAPTTSALVYEDIHWIRAELARAMGYDCGLRGSTSFAPLRGKLSSAPPRADEGRECRKIEPVGEFELKGIRQRSR